MNAILMTSKPGSKSQPSSRKANGLSRLFSGRSMLHYLQSSAGQVWVAARGSIPLTFDYKYDHNDSEICRIPGGGLVIEARYADGSTRDITGEAFFSIVDNRIARLSGHGTIIGIKSGSTMLNISYQGFKTRVTVHVVERNAESYNNAIALLTSQVSSKQNVRSGEGSLCRQFVADVLRMMGLSLPSKASAGDFYKWITRKEARAAGWMEVKDRGEAQRLADLGHPVLAVNQQAVTILNPLNAVNTSRKSPAASVLLARCQSIAGLVQGREMEPMQCFVHV